MKKVVLNRFTELLAIKAREEGNSISRRQVAEETGISLSSIQNWASNSIKRFDSDQIATFCDYFGCTVGDLFIIKENREEIPS